MPLSTEVIGLDFETYSPVSLPDHGLDRYINHPEFRVLRGAMDGPTSEQNFDFITSPRGYEGELERLMKHLQFVQIAAHNATFERAVLKRVGIPLEHTRFIDTAVVSRAAGAASSLEAAAPQLLGTDKTAEGRSLIRLFSMPGKLQKESGSDAFDPAIIEQNPQEWMQFGDYCMLDARLSRVIAEDWMRVLIGIELDYMALTMRMNETGWPVDIQMVHEMQARYEQNKRDALADFRQDCNAPDLNLNSFPQLKKWCLERGVKATSFDEKHVASMLKRLRSKIISMTPGPQKANYSGVVRLLETKQIVGGSSLKKLQTILDHVGDDGRLRHQYMHAGAGQTLRTSGRSVQMQNLKRLHNIRDMDDLLDEDADWTNTELAENLRQVFTSSDPNGQLIVGDFASVESRGLAWLAGAEWKLEAFRQGKDMYKVLAATMFPGVTYDIVTKDQRQGGKVGELSCGYGAGAGAVQEFAKNMSIEMTEGEAIRLVHDWRTVNPEIVLFWADLDAMLHAAVESRITKHMPLAGGIRLTVKPIAMPKSLADMHPSATSIEVSLENSGHTIMRRYFHGCHLRGRDIGYYRPSDRKTGDLWKRDFIHPKTKQREYYKIYGGKLAGILTQSFCRELFFFVLWHVDEWVRPLANVDLIGQFHDEIVLDWYLPNSMSTGHVAGFDETVRGLENLMQDVPWWAEKFPLAAEVKSDYRYTK